MTSRELSPTPSKEVSELDSAERADWNSIWGSSRGGACSTLRNINPANKGDILAMNASKKSTVKSVAGSISGSLEEAVLSGIHEPTHDEIQSRAHEIHLERGGEDGNDLDDWLQAELELKAEQPKEASNTD